jgi:hypothetical protein
MNTSVGSASRPQLSAYNTMAAAVILASWKRSWTQRENWQSDPVSHTQRAGREGARRACGAILPLREPDRGSGPVSGGQIVGRIDARYRGGKRKTYAQSEPFGS